ncbi:MAG: ATP synthase F1 subunit delta [Planctomycetota bacterium]
MAEGEQLKTDAVGRVYAEALLEFAGEAGEADAVADEAEQLLSIMAEGGDLHQLISNPAIGDQDRKQIIKNTFEGKVSDLLFRFLCVVADKGRLASLSSIFAGYLLAVAEQQGRIEVEAYVAAPLDEATASGVADKIGAHLGKQVTLRQHVDASLIGGLKLKIGDRLIDASVASQLRNMRNKMTAAARA